MNIYRVKNVIIGHIIRCPVNDNLYQRTIIIHSDGDDVPITIYSEDKSALELSD